MKTIAWIMLLSLPFSSLFAVAWSWLLHVTSIHPYATFPVSFIWGALVAAAVSYFVRR